MAGPMTCRCLRSGRACGVPGAVISELRRDRIGSSGITCGAGRSGRNSPRFASSQKKDGPNASASEGRLGPNAQLVSNPTLTPFETDDGLVADLGETIH